MRRAPTTAVLWALTIAGCGGRGTEPPPMPAPATVQPGAPGQPTRTVDPTPPPPADRTADPRDVAFMHGMLAHHAQAIVMTDLVPERAESERLRTLARRIEISQADEIARMRAWLETRGVSVAGHRAHHTHDMPGMLAPAQIESLSQLRGEAFDRRFLELMILHHEGALEMVARLLEAGGGSEPELYSLVSHIDADQRAEIERMRRMLAEPKKPGG